MTWLDANRSYVLDMLVRHVQIAVPAVLISVVAAITIGRLAWRWPRVGSVLLAVTSLLYAVPALPLLIVIPVVLSIPLRSDLNLVIALALYGTALLAGTALDAFRSVDPRVREAAEALGYSRAGTWWKVDLPLSFPVLLSGIRVVTVSTVSLVTIGALVGIQSLGNLLTDGFQRGIHAEIVTGIVLTILVAVVLDLLLVAVGFLVTPWRRRAPRSRRSRSPRDASAATVVGA